MIQKVKEMGEKRQRRDRRAASPPIMRLTERDKKIIEAVHLYRVLQQDQVQTLFFGGKSAAQRCLARLYHHGFLDRVFLPVITGRSPTFYVLDKKGVELLRTEMGYEEFSWYPSSKNLKDDFLQHSLAINNVRIAIVKATQNANYELVTWKAEHEMKADYDHVNISTGSGRTQSAPIVPDSYFSLRTPHGRAHFFLELDRGTMTTKRFKTKVAAYIAYQRSGGYERRYGTKSLRVLTVTLSENRLVNLKAATEDVGGTNWFWFAILSNLMPDAVLSSPVWQQAGSNGVKALIEPIVYPTTSVVSPSEF